MTTAHLVLGLGGLKKRWDYVGCLYLFNNIILYKTLFVLANAHILLFVNVKVAHILGT